MCSGRNQECRTETPHPLQELGDEAKLIEHGTGSHRRGVRLQRGDARGAVRAAHRRRRQQRLQKDSRDWCKNHLLRNFCNKLRQICTTTNKKTNTVQLRKKIAEKIINFRTAVTKAAEYRRKQDGPMDEKVKNLRLDLLNIPSHEFGEHKNCLERGGYFCTAEPGSDSASPVPALIEAGLFAALTEAE